jgi:hypothetical protein
MDAAVLHFMHWPPLQATTIPLPPGEQRAREFDLVYYSTDIVCGMFPDAEKEHAFHDYWFREEAMYDSHGDLRSADVSG